jgi:hypothetical protein
MLAPRLSLRPLADQAPLFGRVHLQSWQPSYDLLNGRRQVVPRNFNSKWHPLPRRVVTAFELIKLLSQSCDAGVGLAFGFQSLIARMNRSRFRRKVGFALDKDTHAWRLDWNAERNLGCHHTGSPSLYKYALIGR